MTNTQLIDSINVYRDIDEEAAITATQLVKHGAVGKQVSQAVDAFADLSPTLHAELVKRWNAAQPLIVAESLTR